MFASIELARRIERAAVSLTRAAALAAGRAGRAVDAIAIGEGIGVVSAGGSPFDKVIGIGLDGQPLDTDALDAIERAAAARGAPVQVEITTLADPSIARAISERGYVLVGHEN